MLFTTCSVCSRDFKPNGISSICGECLDNDQDSAVSSDDPAEQLYNQLLGPEGKRNKHFERVSNRLIDLVIHASDIIAEQVNSQSAPEQIRWLLDQRFSAEEIKEFVGRPT